MSPSWLLQAVYSTLIGNTRDRFCTNAQTNKNLEKYNEVYKYNHITRSVLHSLLDLLIFIYKCVMPTCYSVNRLLEALRSENTKNVKVTADITYFLEVLSAFNDTATYDHIVIEFTESLEIDTCLTHVGGM